MNSNAGNRRWWRYLLLICACLVLPMPIDQAQAQTTACPVLGDISGTWRGRGEARRKPVDDFEAIRCRLAIAWKPASSQLVINLQCKSADTDFVIRGSISVLPPGKRLSGVLVSTPGRRRANATGTCTGREMTLVLQFPKDQRDELGDRHMHIALSPARKILSGRIWSAKKSGGGDLLTVKFQR